MEIIIRQTKKTDAEQYVKLTSSVWRTAYAHIMPKEIFDKLDSEVDKRIENFHKIDLNKNENINYVATVDDKIVAVLHATSISCYDHYKDLHYADLMAIYIDTKYQHLGLGKKLFDLITGEFKKQGHKKMVIGVLKENIQSRKAYEKWGCLLDTTYEKKYEKYGYSFPEVFYLYDL